MSRLDALRWCVCLVLVGMALGIVIGLKWPYPSEVCVNGYVVVPSQWGDLVIGDQQICGRDLKFSPLKGPSKLWRGDV